MRSAGSVPSSIESASSSHQRDQLGWLVIAGVWLAFYALGQPSPYVDDLLFIGAAFNLVAGHGLINSYCPAFASMGSSHFFVYVPLHSYVLAGWIEFFGKTRASLAFFQCLAGALSSLGLWRLMRDNKSGLFLPLAIAAATAVYLGSNGLRPDALGLVFLAWGALLLKSKSWLDWALCCVALFLTVITCPNFMTLVPFVIVGGFFVAFRSGTLSRYDYLVRVLLVAGALAITILLFLIMIDFRLSEFLLCFNNNRQRGTHFGLGSALTVISSGGRNGERMLVMIVEPLIVLVGSAAVAVLVPRMFRVDRRYLIPSAIVLAGVSTYWAAFSSTTGMRVPAFFSILAALWFISRLKPPYYSASGKILWVGLYTFYMMAIGHAVVQLLGVPFCPKPVPQSLVAQEIDRLKPAHIYVDEYALDSVYNYNLPPNAADYYFSPPLDFREFPARSEFPPDSILVVSKQTAVYMGDPHAGQYLRESIPPLRAIFPWMIGNPYDCVLIRAGPGL